MAINLACTTPTVRCTLQLEGVPQRKDIKQALEVYDVEVERVKRLKDSLRSTILVTIKASDENLRRLKHQFPLVIDDCNVNYTNEWYHSLDTPCFIVSHDLPYSLNRDSLEIYLDCNKIKIKAINEDDDGSTITVELDDSADLPYLVTKTHTIKGQTVVFTERPTSDLISSPSDSVNIYSCTEDNENIGPISLGTPDALKITGMHIHLNEDTVKSALRTCFSQKPYDLQIKHCVVEGDTAYLTFTDEQGVTKVMIQPPPRLWGLPIVCTSVPITDVPAFQTPPRTFENQNSHSNEVEEKFPVENGKWQVIMKQQHSKYEKLQQLARKKKVILLLKEPMKDSYSDKIVITLKGEVRSLDNIKGRLEELFDEVLMKTISLQPDPGQYQIIRENIDAKCRELESTHKIAIKYKFVEANSTTWGDPQISKHYSNVPCCLIEATSRDGLHVTVYSGDFNKNDCDAPVIFIPDNEITMTQPTGYEHEVHSGMKTVISSNGNQTCYHVSLPHLTDASRPLDVMTRALEQFFNHVVCNGNKEIIIAPPPVNYPVADFAQAVLNVLASQFVHSNLSVTIFIKDTKHKHVFLEKMKELGYSFFSEPTTLVNTTQPLQKHGSTSNLTEVVQISKGNILDLEVDVIVNSVTLTFDLSPQLTKICGQKLLDEVQTHISTLGKLEPGQIVVTSAYNTRAKAIYHVALPKYDDADSMRHFKEAIQNILKKIKAKGIQSIAIPCLGAANLGYLTRETTPVVFDEVVSFHVNNPGIITCFHFVVDQDSDFKVLSNEFRKKIKRPPRSEMLTVLPRKVPLKKNEVTFKIYGLEQETIDCVEKELRALIPEEHTLNVRILSQLAAYLPSRGIVTKILKKKTFQELTQDAIKATELMLLKAWSCQQELRILVTGKTGQGKSTLINGILGAQVAAEGAGAKRCTAEVTEYSVTIQDVPVTVFDSPGLQDGTVNEEEYIQDMKDKCKHLSLVLYCTKMTNTRLTDADKNAMQKLTKAFGEEFWNYAVFVLTFANKEDCFRKDDRDIDTASDLDGHDKMLLKQRFEHRLKLWKEELKDFLVSVVGVSPSIAEEIPVVPTGDYRKTAVNFQPLSLPDRDNWFIWFWDACCLRVKDTKLFLQVNYNRMVAVKDKTQNLYGIKKPTPATQEEPGNSSTSPLLPPFESEEPIPFLPPFESEEPTPFLPPFESEEPTPFLPPIELGEPTPSLLPIALEEPTLSLSPIESEESTPSLPPINDTEDDEINKGVTGKESNIKSKRDDDKESGITVESKDSMEVEQVIKNGKEVQMEREGNTKLDTTKQDDNNISKDNTASKLNVPTRSTQIEDTKEEPLEPEQDHHPSNQEIPIDDERARTILGRILGRIIGKKAASYVDEVIRYIGEPGRWFLRLIKKK